MSAVSITTPRLVLVPFGPQHLTETYVGWLNDAALMRFSENRHRRHTLESNASYAAQFDHKTRMLWAITLRESGSHIGNINAYLDANNGTADVGLLVGEREAQGRGLGLEAWRGVMLALFAHYGARKVTGGCMATNVAMLHIMSKAGMQSDGTRVGQLLVDGEPVDVVHAATFAADFAAPDGYEIHRA